MADKHFLGKPYPKHKIPKPEHHVSGKAFAFLIVGAILCATGAALFSQQSRLGVAIANPSPTAATIIKLADIGSSRTLADASDGVPTNLKVSIVAGMPTLAWDADAKATSINIYRGINTANTTLYVPGLFAASRTWQDTTTTPGTTYYYQVGAVLSNGSVALSDEVAIKAPSSSTTGTTGTTGTTTTNPTPTPITADPSLTTCDVTPGHPLHEAFYPTSDHNMHGTKLSLFPLIPPEILNPTGCGPSLWTLPIFDILIFKFLGILNWLIFTFALGFTIYAGVLYVSGFANEGNVKRARTILITTYVGLIIALSARLIMGAVVATVADNNVNSALNSPNNNSILNGVQ